MEGIKDTIRQRWYLRWMLLFSNWLAQGMINADRTEKIYKIFFTIFLTLLFLFIFINYNLSLILSIVLSFIIAHTINWLINGSITTILLHRLFIGSLNKEKAFTYLYDLEKRLNDNDAVIGTAVFGSISRGELKKTSDIDITFVRQKGLKNAFKSILFMIKEKFYTNKNQIPIEPFLADSVKYMKKRYKKSEIPVIIKNKDGIITKYYEKTQSLSEAAIKNGLSLDE